MRFLAALNDEVVKFGGSLWIALQFSAGVREERREILDESIVPSKRSFNVAEQATSHRSMPFARLTLVIARFDDINHCIRVDTRSNPLWRGELDTGAKAVQAFHRSTKCGRNYVHCVHGNLRRWRIENSAAVRSNGLFHG